MGIEWQKELDPREQAQVRHAIAYAEQHADAGAPGHGQFVLIAKLARLLNQFATAPYKVGYIRPEEHP